VGTVRIENMGTIFVNHHSGGRIAFRVAVSRDMGPRLDNGDATVRLPGEFAGQDSSGESGANH
jgi:hypothetical protein